jgi:starch synthase
LALQERLSLTRDDSATLFGVVSRLTWQKGMDVLLAAMPELLAQGAQLALLGSGDLALEQGFLAMAAANPGKLAVVTGYNETLAHEIQAGVDALLVPSRFEPCGLTQLCALRYGAIPVVARTGGLADSVVDANQAALATRAGTGIVFSPVTSEALVHAIERVVKLRSIPTKWRAMQRRAMRQDVGWAGPAAQYAALYRTAMGR